MISFDKINICSFKRVFFVLSAAFLTISCAFKKDILYFQNVKSNSQDTITYLQNKIQVNDILFIRVSSLVPESVESFNIQLGALTITNLDILKVFSYLVSEDGNIVFPVLGKISLKGKSTIEAEEIIKKMLIDKGQVKEPIVSVRIMNCKITILGDVTAPGTYNFTEQNISLSQALGYAGDLTINGKRRDVLLIREENGTRTYTKLDLTSSEWLKGPYYYVKQNDVIIVSPNGPKIMTAGYVGNLSVLLSALSLGISLYFLLKK